MKKTKLWKLATFALMFVFVLAGTVGLITWAENEDIGFSSDAIIVDYINETITVKVVDRAEYPTVDLDQLDTIVYYTEKYTKDVTKWDACEVRERDVKDENGTVVGSEVVAVFDFSWVNDSKTVRLYLCGNNVNKKVVAVDLTWEENFGVEFTGTLLATDITEAETWKEVYKKYPNFSEDTGYFIFTLEENGRDMSYFELENVMWRKGDDGAWRTFDELDLKEMTIRGIKLEFCIKANGDTNYETGTRASSIAKISVSKLSSAPLVTVNPDTMSIAMKNGLEFSFDKEEWFMIPEYSKKFSTEEYVVTEATREAAIETIYTSERVTGLVMQQMLQQQATDFVLNSAMDRETLEANYGNYFKFTDEGIVVYVREFGTQKKAASKIAEVIIPYAVKDTAKPSEDALKISYGESKTNTGGIVIENTSEYKYQVGVITPDDVNYEDVVAGKTENLDLKDMKWTSIKGGKMLKLANKKVPKGSYLIYRIAGEEGSLPSTYVVMTDSIEYDTLTYAGIATAKKTAGQELEATVSTNIEIDDPELKFEWQTCEDVKAEEPVWTAISGATKSTYTLTNAEANKYVRVVITYKNGEPVASDYVGPIKANASLDSE